MKRSVTMIHYFCDGCGEIMDDDCNLYEISEYNIDSLDPYDGDWIQHGEHHYCPNCYQIENGGVFVKTKIV